MHPVQAQIEDELAQLEPEVEVLLAEVVGDKVLRLFIDHPGGVSIALCERVTRHLSGVRARYALEVSSPGSERPLTKPEHFRRFLGSRARVRTREPHELGPAAEGRRARSFTGELVGASEDEVTVAAEIGVVSIPYSQIQRSNLVRE